MHRTTGTEDRMMTGFPASEGSRVTLANWQEPSSVRWSFRHMREIIPSQVIPAGPTAAPLPAEHQIDLSEVEVTRLDGSNTSAEQVFADTITDALLVLHEGAVVGEQYYSGMLPTTPHLVMSVSKSIVGCVAGILTARGDLEPEALVTHYVPEAAESGYAEATVRNLLDMRTGVAFRETYDALDAEVRVMERSAGWRPHESSDPVGCYDYLATLGRDGPHGGGFTYRSADTNMLGWVCERAAGTRMADLVSTHLWQPLGAEGPAEVTCDAVGSAIHDGGISTVPRDLSRFGQMLLDGGMVGDAQVVPARWLQESHHPDADVRAAFASSDNEEVLPGGWSRNQFWFVPASRGTALVCLGIHGQMVYVNTETRIVGVKLSSWQTPQHTGHLVDTLRAFGAIGIALHAGAGHEAARDPSA